VILIADEGAGIPEAEWGRIFEPFERLAGEASSGGEGQGLGLAIAREVARVHGGNVRVLASSSRGTIIEIVLPGGQLAAAIDQSSTTRPKSRPQRDQ
jgi:signal transduction histidine kinase